MASYLWGLDLSGSPQGAGGVGGLLSIVASGGSTRYYPAYDGNGNVSEYVNQSGTEVAHFEYDPFGNLTVDDQSNASDFPYRFSTKPQDPITGLYYYGYRYYDPVTGRWGGRDPIGERGGVNLYGFVGNRQSGAIDSLGLSGLIFYLRPNPILTNETLNPRWTIVRPTAPPIVVPSPMPLPPAIIYIPPPEPSDRWVPYPDPDSGKPNPDPEHENVDWDLVDKWTEEPTSENERQDRRHDVNDCCRLRDKYKAIRKKRPLGEGSCDALYEKIRGIQGEIRARKQYVDTNCDEIPWKNGMRADHQGQIQQLRNEVKRLMRTMRSSGCWEKRGDDEWREPFNNTLPPNMS